MRSLKGELMPLPSVAKPAAHLADTLVARIRFPALRVVIIFRDVSRRFEKVEEPYKLFMFRMHGEKHFKLPGKTKKNCTAPYQ